MIVRLRTAVPAAALGGAVVAGLVLAVMPAASPGPPDVPAASAVPPHEDGHVTQVEEPEVGGVPVGAVTPGYGSASSGPAGVPVGFARSPDGAVAAATAWLTTMEGSGLFDERRRGEVLTAIGDPGFVSAVSARLADRTASLGLDASGRPAVGFVVATVWASRGAYRVVSYEADVAQVEVWHLYQLDLVPPGSQPGPGQWRRATISMRWGDGDWRVTEDIQVVDGPDPRVANPSRLERAEVLAGFGDGWRLYADARL